MKPPESIPRVALNLVLISMDILDSRERMKITSIKHSKTSVRKSDHPTSQVRHLEKRTTEEPAYRQNSLATRTHAMHLEGKSVNHTVEREDAGQKRKRAPDTDTVAPSLAPHSTDVYNFEAVTNSAGFKKLVDGALRLAICGTSKAVNGIKVKASSIHSGLAELIPELLSPGFSLVGFVLVATKKTNHSVVHVSEGTAIACNQPLSRVFHWCKSYVFVAQGKNGYTQSHLAARYTYELRSPGPHFRP
jgi:hypothetical protein